MSSEESSSKGLWIGVVLALLVMVVLAGGFGINSQNKTRQIQRQLEETQQQLADVVTEKEEAKVDVVDEIKDQVTNVAESIGDVDNPLLRFALMKQYVANLASALKPESKQQLDTVVVYVQKNPTVLLQPEQLPASYSATLTAIKQELTAARAQAVAVLKQQIANTLTPTPAAVVGQTYNLTGMLTMVETDPVLGGTYFKMTDTNYGEPFYLYLSPSNATQVQQTMLDKEVTVQVKVTSIQDGFVTYTVVSGPTLATAQPTSKPTTKPTSRPTSQPTVKPTVQATPSVTAQPTQSTTQL